MDVQNPLWLKEVEDVLFDENAERGKDAKSLGVFLFELFDGFEVVASFGVEDDVRGGLKDFESEVGERPVAEEDDFWFIHLHPRERRCL